MRLVPPLILLEWLQSSELLSTFYCSGEMCRNWSKVQSKSAEQQRGRYVPVASVKHTYHNRANINVFSDSTVQPGIYSIWLWAERKWMSMAWRSGCAETNNKSGWHLMKHFLPQHCVIAETAFHVALPKTWHFFHASLIFVIIRGLHFLKIYLTSEVYLNHCHQEAVWGIFPPPCDESSLCLWAKQLASCPKWEWLFSLPMMLHWCTE